MSRYPCEHIVGCCCGLCTAERRAIERMMGSGLEDGPPRSSAPPAPPKPTSKTSGTTGTLYINGEPFETSSVEIKFTPEQLEDIRQRRAFVRQTLEQQIRQFFSVPYQPQPLTVEQFKGQGRLIPWDKFPDGKDALVVDLKNGSPGWLFTVVPNLNDGPHRRYVVLIRASTLESIRNEYPSEDDLTATCIWASFMTNNQRP